ncbi:MAG: hypothetical protein P1V97_11170 [Planctomycetota bacterium]|nr:hypothetical protein [Planctomycetota bacterium]
MTVYQYLCIVVCLVGLGLTTVAEHVQRVRIGYEVRRLEKEHRRLKQERKTRRLMWERLAAAETVSKRSIDLKIVRAEDIEALQMQAGGGH